MSSDFLMLSGHVLTVSALCIGVFLICWSHRAQERRLVEQDLFIRQLLDRIATYEFAKNDAMIPRMHAATPPSVKEEQGISGPHGRSRNTVAVPAEKPAPPSRKTRTFKLDMADEYNVPKE